MDEVWIDIKGFNGLYQISNLGSVKSFHKCNEKILKLKNHTNGYKQIALSNDGVCKKFYIHRLVAEHFIPNIESKKEVNHIDGDKTNNVYINLEWCTRKENVQHQFKTGLGYVPRLQGEDVGNSKLLNSQVEEIFLFYHRYNVNVKDLSIRYNVNVDIIKNIVNRKSYRCVTENICL